MVRARNTFQPSAPTVSGPFLSEGDFVAHNPSPIDAEEIGYELTDEDDFVNPFSDREGGGPSDECSQTSFTFADGGQTAIATLDADFAKCWNQQPQSEPDSPKIAKAHLKMYAKITCEGGDLSVVKNGSPIPYGSCRRYSILVNFASESRAVGESSDSINKHATMSGAGRPCEFVRQGEFFVETSECRGLRWQTQFYGEASASATTNGSGSSANSDTAWRIATVIKKVAFNGRKGDLNSKYFHSGTAAISINDWKGTLTYTGPNTPPRWTMTRGSETRSGVISENSESPTGPNGGFSLAGEKNKKPTRRSTLSFRRLPRWFVR